MAEDKQVNKTAPQPPARPAFLDYGDVRDHVTGEPVGRSEYAVEVVSRCLTAAAQHMADLYEEGGSMAVARATYTGGKSLEELAAQYERLLAVARERAGNPEPDEARPGSASPGRARRGMAGRGAAGAAGGAL
jgi:hypothetical protein